jgi:hypothetical protein
MFLRQFSDRNLIRLDSCNNAQKPGSKEALSSSFWVQSKQHGPNGKGGSDCFRIKCDRSNQ